jgi:predicted phosphate transport protein (TIGR00153 family)
VARLALIPQERRFYDLFEQAAANLVQAATQLVDLLEHFQDVPQKVQRVRDLEHVGDNITHELMALLHRTFVTPLDREDISLLAHSLDDVMDFMDAAAISMLIYRIKAPTEKARQLARLIVQCTEVVDHAIKKLRNRGGFRDILNDAIELNRLENEADQVLREALMELFDNHTNPVEIIKWREIYEQLESATDRCEDVANILEGVVLKYS